MRIAVAYIFLHFTTSLRKSFNYVITISYIPSFLKSDYQIWNTLYIKRGHKGSCEISGISKLSHYYGMFSHQKRIKKISANILEKEIIYWITNDNLRSRIGQSAFLRSLVCTIQFVRFFKSAEISIGPRRLWYLLPLLSSDEKYTYFDIIFFLNWLGNS